MSLRFRNLNQLYADIAALPFVSEHSFLHAFNGIPTPNLHHQGVASFYVEAESLAAKYGLSVDELTNVKDWIWWKDMASVSSPARNKRSYNEGRSLGSYLKNLSVSSLTLDGSLLRPVIRADDPRSELGGNNHNRDARQSLVWLGQSVPLDLLEAATPGIETIEPLSKSTRTFLGRRGFAEMHLHLGASICFDDQWRHLQAVFGAPDLPFDFLRTPHGFLDQGEKFGTWLLVSSVVRYQLAKYLQRKQHHQDFSTYIQKELADLRFRNLDAHLLLHCIVSLAYPIANDFHSSRSLFHRLQSLFSQISHRVSQPFDSYDALDCIDPIFPLLPVRENMSCEKAFVLHGISYINQLSDISLDPLFTTLFWQTQKLRCLFFRHLVQKPDIAGLVWFTRYYRRIWPARREVGSIATRLIGGAINDGFGRGLRSLEVRMAPSNKPDDILYQIDQVRLGSLALNESQNSTREIRSQRIRNYEQRTNAPPEVTPVRFETGLVLHFIKKRERDSPDLLSAKGSNRHDRVTSDSFSKYRYGDYYSEIREQANALETVLRHYPLSLFWLRAIDICDDELAIPVWVFSDSFKKVIRASREASKYLHYRFGVHTPPMQPNSHVGEDFSHLLTGMRLIDQNVDHLDIGEGNRVGHALALGTDPLAWCNNSGPVATTNETRLFDLVWALHSLDSLPAQLSTRGHRSLGHEIEAIIHIIFASIPSHQRPGVAAIGRLQQNLTSIDALRRIGFPDNSIMQIYEMQEGLAKTSLDNDDLLLLYYLTDRGIQEHALSIRLVDPSAEGNILLALQNGLRRKLANKGIAVEVNPTSNLVVGNYADLREHPMWRLNRPDYDDDIPQLTLCVGSDDPLVFTTDLPQEYQRLIDALGQMGYSETQVDDWVDRLREKSLDLRNTQENVSFSPVASLRI